MECLHGLLWWLHLPRLYLGVSLHQVSPVLPFGQAPRTWVGAPSRLSGRFGPVGHPSGSVVCLRQGPASCSAGTLPVPVTSPRSHSGCLLRHITAVHSLRKGSGPWSPLLTTLAPAFLRSMEYVSIRLPSRFLPGSDTVLTDSLSRPHQLPLPEWSIHMTVFLFLRRLWLVQMVSLPPRPLIVVRFTSPLSGFRSQQARTRFSSSGTAFRLPVFHPVAVIRVLSRSSGPPRGRNSLLCLSTRLSALGFRTWSSSCWLLQ